MSSDIQAILLVTVVLFGGAFLLSGGKHGRPSTQEALQEASEVTVDFWKTILTAVFIGAIIFVVVSLASG